jgi:transcriptional accessory protein Tex/SPT6
MMNDSLCRIIAGELQARAEQVEAAVRLLDEGNTVPFIARYRKEVTGGLDDTQLRNLETRLGYLRELEDRRQAILKSIAEQGKLTDAGKSHQHHAEQNRTGRSLPAVQTEAPHPRADRYRSRAGAAG